MTLAIFAFAALFILIASCGLLLVYRDTTVKRLANVVSQRLGASGRPMSTVMQRSARTVETIITPFQKILPRSPQDASVIQKRLMRAGFREDRHLNVFYASKVMV